MTRGPISSAEVREVVNRRVMVVLLSAVTLFAPMFCYISTVSVNILAISWMYINWGYSYAFGLPDPVLLFLIIPFLAIRFAFVYQLDKYHRGATTRKRVLLLGILSEGPSFFMLLLMLMALLFPALFWLYLSVPIPILLITGTFIMWRRPVPEPVSPWNEQPELTEEGREIAYDLCSGIGL